MECDKGDRTLSAPYLSHLVSYRFKRGMNPKNIPTRAFFKKYSFDLVMLSKIVMFTISWAKFGSNIILIASLKKVFYCMIMLYHSLGGFDSSIVQALFIVLPWSLGYILPKIKMCYI